MSEGTRVEVSTEEASKREENKNKIAAYEKIAMVILGEGVPFTCDNLRIKLREKNLPVSGTKLVLVERLIVNSKNEQQPEGPALAAT